MVERRNIKLGHSRIAKQWPQKIQGTKKQTIEARNLSFWVRYRVQMGGITPNQGATIIAFIHNYRLKNNGNSPKHADLVRVFPILTGKKYKTE